MRNDAEARQGRRRPSEDEAATPYIIYAQNLYSFDRWYSPQRFASEIFIDNEAFAFEHEADVRVTGVLLRELGPRLQPLAAPRPWLSPSEGDEHLLRSRLTRSPSGESRSRLTRSPQFTSELDR